MVRIPGNSDERPPDACTTRCRRDIGIPQSARPANPKIGLLAMPPAMAAAEAESMTHQSNQGTRRRSRRLSRSVVAAIDESKILGIRAGARSNHRFIGIWAVVVGGRVFARSWTQKPGGWYRTVLADPICTIQIGDRQLRVRAMRATSERIRDAVEDAYAAKYSTPGSMKYVRGFRGRRRRDTTIEFIPVSAGKSAGG